MTDLRPIEEKVLRKMLKQPVHSRTLHLVKSLVASLVARGLVERVSRETNMKVYLAITPAGRRALGEIQNMKRGFISISEPIND